MEAAVRSRTGSVLGRQTILKLYHFPGQKRTPITEELGIAGAPNLCKVSTKSKRFITEKPAMGLALHLY